MGTYYRTEKEFATKQTLTSDSYYRRFIYQGLPEERELLATVERQEVVEKLISQTSFTGTGIFIEPAQLVGSPSSYKEIATWLGSSPQPKAAALSRTLQIACNVLDKAGASIDELSLYGAASFGLVGTTPKVVTDVDLAFKMTNIAEFRGVIDSLSSKFSWSEIDPFKRLPEKRQYLKAKRWATSQIRLTDPYPISIDLKVSREPGNFSLWDVQPSHKETEQFSGDLYVVDDKESFCTSPALYCEDRSGNERILLLDGYQYIGCAVLGDVINVQGKAYSESPVVLVTQNEQDKVMPDFSNVPIT